MAWQKVVMIVLAVCLGMAALVICCLAVLFASGLVAYMDFISGGTA